MDLGKNQTNRQFLKIRPDARTEAQKEDVSGETQTYGNPTSPTVYRVQSANCIDRSIMPNINSDCVTAIL